MLVQSSFLLWTVIQVIILGSQITTVTAQDEDLDVCAAIRDEQCVYTTISTTCPNKCSKPREDKEYCGQLDEDQCYNHPGFLRDCPNMCEDTCVAKDDCRDLGTDLGVTSGCLPKEERCDGTTYSGNNYCKNSHICSCCVPHRRDQCNAEKNEKRKVVVDKTCKSISEPICGENSQDSEECNRINQNCRDYVCKMLDTHPFPHFRKPESFVHEGKCDCSWHPGGCKITKEALPPVNKACKCQYQNLWRCTGTVVDCKTPGSMCCVTPDDSLMSCEEGGGNCGGYNN